MMMDLYYIMITETFFRNWIIELFNDNPIKWSTIQNALKNNYNLNDFLIPTHNKVKGDIFEHIIKYVFIFKGHETYLYNEIPPSLKQKLIVFMIEETQQLVNYTNHQVEHYNQLYDKRIEQINVVKGIKTTILSKLSDIDNNIQRYNELLHQNMNVMQGGDKDYTSSDNYSSSSSSSLSSSNYTNY